MKIIAMLLLILVISESTNAARICTDYITDEWPNSRYTVEDISGDYVVTDSKTRLMWKQCSEGLSDIDCLTGVASTHNWQQALDLANIENFAGFSDWRLPNVKELLSIATMNCNLPAINETFFPNTPSVSFWTSSLSIRSSGGIIGGAWAINFDNGIGVFRSRENDNIHLRLVRSI